jgi:hypothetical protein
MDEELTVARFTPFALLRRSGRRGGGEGEERGKRGRREGEERGKRGRREGEERGKRGGREGDERGKGGGSLRSFNMPSIRSAPPETK